MTITSAKNYTKNLKQILLKILPQSINKKEGMRGREWIKSLQTHREEGRRRKMWKMTYNLIIEKLLIL